MQPSEIEDLDNDFANDLYSCIEILQSNEMLMALNVSDYPNMKDSARNKLFKGLKNQATPSILKGEARAISVTDLAQMINKG